MNEIPQHQMDDELTDTLGAADAMPTGAPPVGAIVERGRRDRRRLRAAAVGGVAAAVVAVVGGLALVSGPDQRVAPAGEPDSSADGTGEDVAPDEDTGPVPAPPEGTRWVGKAGVMVAVPADWSTNALRCARTPVEDSVIIDPGPRPMCQAPRPDGVSSVELRKDRAPLGGAAEDLGDGIRRAEAECQGSAGVCTTVVRAEDAGVSVYVASTDAELVEQITASARRMPDGAVVVPARANESLFIGGEGRAGYVRQLRRAGLEVGADRGLDPNGTFDIEPAPGSVVAEGSVVRLAIPAR